jgi:subtilisin family serine protease
MAKLEGGKFIHPDLVNAVREHFSLPLAGDFDEPDWTWAKGHGTHTAGIIAAQVNGSGTAGICAHCSLMVLRITSPTSGFTCSSGVNAMLTAATSGAQVMNMSLSLQSACSAAGMLGTLTDAINFAALREVSIAAAAGNFPDGQSATNYPAGHPYAMSVAATDRDGVRMPWSADGKIDFAAPGNMVLSSFHYGQTWEMDGSANWRTQQFVINTNRQDAANPAWDPYPGSLCKAFTAYSSATMDIGFCTGTSMAAPMLAGSVALVRAANPLLTQAQVKALLSAHANPFGQSASIVGAGVPQVGDTVNDALFGGWGNYGMTPLFAFTNGASANRFYTTVPQMASAAIANGIKHGSNAVGGFVYSPANSEASAIPG